MKNSTYYMNIYITEWRNGEVVVLYSSNISSGGSTSNSVVAV